jgi:hypothetical protein
MDDKEIKEWVDGMKEYLVPRGRVDAEHLALTFLQAKERLDTQMDAAVIVAALIDVLVAKGVVTEKEVDGAVEKLAEEIEAEE